MFWICIIFIIIRLLCETYSYSSPIQSCAGSSRTLFRDIWKLMSCSTSSLLSPNRACIAKSLNYRLLMARPWPTFISSIPFLMLLIIIGCPVSSIRIIWIHSYPDLDGDPFILPYPELKCDWRILISPYSFSHHQHTISWHGTVWLIWPQEILVTRSPIFQSRSWYSWLSGSWRKACDSERLSSKLSELWCLQNFEHISKILTAIIWIVDELMKLFCNCFSTS